MDISGEEHPPDGQEPPDESGKALRKRTRSEAGLPEEEDELAGYSPPENNEMEGAPPMEAEDEHMGDEDVETEAPDTVVDQSRRTSATEASAPPIGASMAPPQSQQVEVGTTYGPARRDRTSPEERHDALFRSEGLQRALNRSVDMLDLGDVRLPRTPLATDEVRLAEEDDGDDYMDAFLVDKGMGLDVFLAQKNRTEVQDKDLNSDEKEQKRSGMKKEWDKLLRTTSINFDQGPHREQGTDHPARDGPKEHIRVSICEHTERISRQPGQVGDQVPVVYQGLSRSGHSGVGAAIADSFS